VIVRLLLFATAREAAGSGHDVFDLDAGATLDRLLALAIDRYGDGFERVLDTARVWVNGEEPAAAHGKVLRDGDEVAVLPPVSGGHD